MGIYYITIFIKNINNDENYIELSCFDKIITIADDIRGYILKDELIKSYGHLINEEDININSRIEEYSWTTYDISDLDVTITKSLDIK